MSKFYMSIIALLSASAMVLACDPLDTLGRSFPGDTVFMGVEPIEFDDMTRTSAEVDESAGLSFKWTDGDAVGVYSTAGGFSRFSLSGGSGTGLATFDGQGFSLTPGATYYASYPYDGSNTSFKAVPVSYASRSVSGENCLEDILAFDPMYASAVADEQGRALFSFKHVSSFARIRAEMPAAGTFTRMDLVPVYGGLQSSGKLNLSDGSWTGSGAQTSTELSLSGISSSSKGDEVTMWVPLAPQDMSDADIVAVMYDADEQMYTSRLQGRNFKPGKAYRWDTAMTAYSDSQSSGVSVSSYKEASLSSLPSGQYSGITWISDNSYALVHDGAAGGGIYLVELNLSSGGGSGIKASYEIPAGTSSSSVSRDPEGIVYFPKAGTLFVAGEGDQAILEYDMDGNPTGRRLEVPSDMSTYGINSGTGFESLTYNSSTGLFWTTTEDILKKDASTLDTDGSLLRLQSFGEDLSAGERYLYLTDAPVYSSSSARNYAFGVSDLLALDDGRLIVMEREAFVPSGSYFDILVNTVVVIKLYEVDPVHDAGGILSKRLVESFTISGATSFANYEGICLGPQVNGKQTILMVSDSQDRYEGVLQDWLKVLYIN